jgi:hypothetical protein
MASDDWLPEDRLPEDWLERWGETLHNEQLYKQIIDPSPSVEMQAEKVIRARRKIHVLLHSLFAMDDYQDIWRRRAYAFERLEMENKPVSLIARELECDEATIYRYVKDMRRVFRFYDALYIELYQRLQTRRQVQRVFHYISIGKSREEIQKTLRRELTIEEVDYAYSFIRQTFVKILSEFFRELRLNTKAVRSIRRYLQHFKGNENTCNQ